jgi:hypothetical protein
VFNYSSVENDKKESISIKLNIMITNMSSKDRRRRRRHKAHCKCFFMTFELPKEKKMYENLQRSVKQKKEEADGEEVPGAARRKGKLGINENDKHEKVYIHDNLTLISLL